MSERNAKMKQNGHEQKNFAKNVKFSQNDFSFLLKTIVVFNIFCLLEMKQLSSRNHALMLTLHSLLNPGQ